MSFVSTPVVPSTPSGGKTRGFFFYSSAMSIPILISIYFMLASALVLFTKFCAPLNQLLAYGKVAQTQRSSGKGLARLVQLFARLTVPKKYFGHFYILFMILQWAQLPYAANRILTTQPGIVWLLLTLQATRRAAESIALTQWGLTSRMHVSHYAVGILFYICVAANCYFGLLESSAPALGPRHMVAMLVFAIFSLDQFQNHQHLAGLVKYSVPTFRMFLLVACAHYSDEIAIYLAVAAAAWRWQVLQVSVAFFAAWVFVAVNLSVSGLESLRYYRTKFDDYKVTHAVVPLFL